MAIFSRFWMAEIMRSATSSDVSVGTHLQIEADKCAVSNEITRLVGCEIAN